MLKALFKKLDGYKTYLICLAAIIASGVGLYRGILTADGATSIITMALVGSGIRHGVAKK